MKNLLILPCILMSATLVGQNVGVGETVPTHKLEIKASSISNPPLLIKSSLNEELMKITDLGNRHLIHFGGTTTNNVGVVNITNSQYAGFANPLLRLAAAYDYPDGASYTGLEFGNNANPAYGFRFRAQSGTNLSNYRFALDAIRGNIPSPLLVFNSAGAVGIGGNPAVGKVDINHNSLIDTPHIMLTETDNDYARLSFRNTAFNGFWSLAGLSTGSSINDRLNFYHSFGGDVMTLKGSGNVGIGAEPDERLEIGSGNIKLNNSFKGIMLNADDRPLISRNFDPFTGGLYNGVGRWGLFMSTNRLNLGIPNLAGKGLDIVAYNTNSSGTSLFTVLSNGNVGIGISPTATLDINGSVKLEGLNLFEFGAGVAGKEVNAGKVGYNAFGQNALTFLGAGTTALNRAVYFYAEGGTTFNGSTNTTGEINRPPTGAANMVPIAYGSIAADGTIRAGTGNFTVAKNGAGSYIIYVTGETYSPNTHIAQATILGPSTKFIKISTIFTEPGALIFFIDNTSNVNIDGEFTFTLFKP